MEKTIVTGLGCISALGRNKREFWDGLISGKTGISAIDGFSRDYLRNVNAGEIKITPDLLQFAKQRSIKSRISLFAHWAIDEALEDSGITKESLRTGRTGLVLGLSLGMSLVEGVIEYEHNRGETPGNLLDDFSALKDELVESYQINGEAILVTTACASGTNAIGLAKDMIDAGECSRVICGGMDTLDRMKYLGHTGLNTLTPTSVAPFTAARDGTLFGEGAGILVLEKSDNNAVAKNNDYPACSGAGFSCDAAYVTAPDETGAGAIHVMREAISEAGISPGQVDYINLHGSGTIANDEMESKALREVFGDNITGIPISSIKPAVGHLMGAAGALEAVATVLAIQNQEIPPTLNGKEDSSFSLNIVRAPQTRSNIVHALSNSFGFGGCNGAVLFSKREEIG